MRFVDSRSRFEHRALGLSLGDDRKAHLRLHPNFRQVLAAKGCGVAAGRTRLHPDRPTLAILAAIHSAAATRWGVTRSLVFGANYRFADSFEFCQAFVNRAGGLGCGPGE